jgi:hypothetical protein
MQVISTINSTNEQYVNYSDAPTSSVRALQNAVLTELPGAAFAILTLIYVVSSLVRL